MTAKKKSQSAETPLRRGLQYLAPCRPFVAHVPRAVPVLKSATPPAPLLLEPESKPTPAPEEPGQESE